MYATAIIPALIVTLGRFFITESPSWLQCAARSTRQKHAVNACCTASRNTRQNIALSQVGRRQAATAARQSPSWRCSMGATAAPRSSPRFPWFLQDLGTYGIGIFTPTILAAAFGSNPDHVRSMSDLISDDILAAKGAALITCC